jgi:K+-transporting ATPase KdpF subunit
LRKFATGCRAAVERSRIDMDYVIAGIAAVGMFGYLLYALLRPERF